MLLEDCVIAGFGISLHLAVVISRFLLPVLTGQSIVSNSTRQPVMPDRKVMLFLVRISCDNASIFSSLV